MASLKLLGAATWMPVTLKIAFGLRVSGSGPFLERASQVAGGWIFKHQNATVTFTVTNAGAISAGLMTGGWHIVVATYRAGGCTLTVDGVQNVGSGSVVLVAPPGANDVKLGYTSIDVSLDELYLLQ